MAMKETVSTLQVLNLLLHQCRKPRFVSQNSRSAISAHKANTLNIQFTFCKEVFHKLKHIFCFGGCFQFFTEKQIVLYGTNMDKLTTIPNIGSFV